jgi:hypothetical protein
MSKKQAAWASTTCASPHALMKLGAKAPDNAQLLDIFREATFAQSDIQACHRKTFRGADRRKASLRQASFSNIRHVFGTGRGPS